MGYQLQRMDKKQICSPLFVDENIDVLCKHIRVYMWEAIREMSYMLQTENQYIRRIVCILGNEQHDDAKDVT